MELWHIKTLATKHHETKDLEKEDFKNEDFENKDLEKKLKNNSTLRSSKNEKLHKIKKLGKCTLTILTELGKYILYCKYYILTIYEGT